MQLENVESRFYRIVDGSRVVIQKVNVLNFWESQGYRKLILKNGSYQLIKISMGSIIEPVEDYRLIDEVRGYLELNEPEFNLVYEEFLRKDFTSKGVIKSLKSVEVPFNYGSKEEALFFYSNCVVRVTKDSIEKVKYEDYKGFVWKKQIFNREFIYNHNYEKSEFAKFMFNLCGNDLLRFESLRTVTGFLSHTYKNPALNPAVILIDEDVDITSDEARGGKGKSLYARGLGFIVPMYFKEAKNISKNFPFSGFENHHKLMFYDDIKKDFDFENLFSILTGDFNVEKKYKNEEVIAFSESPKVLISTNYILSGGKGFSYDRRKLEFEISSYYGKHLSPKDDFGHLLFDDWSAEEWTLFDSFMINNTQEFLDKGIIMPKSINIELNKLKSETNPKFVEYMDSKLEEGDKFIKRNIFNEFRDKYKPEFYGLTPNQFGKWLETYFEYKEIDIIVRKSNGDQIVEFLNPKKDNNDN